jgi:basic membrane lipoprotein Med (substrate-binding protein (PBP1-ABC) superfamily)
MKKILALVLVLAMVAALFVGCATAKKDTAAEGNPANSIPDAMTSSDGKYEIAFVTDVGQLKDKSFNQGTYDGVKLFANENGKSYKYYQPANSSNATDDDRFNAMKDAADNGAKVIGVDVDQSFSSNTVITSALKGISEAAQLALKAAYGSEDDWAKWGGVCNNLGAKEDAVGLPVATWSLKNWTVDAYKAMLADIVSGKIEIDDDPANVGNLENVTLNKET